MDNDSTNNKQCFVIMPIGARESEARSRSDKVLRHVIRPAVSECGYVPIRADEIAEPGLITSQIIQHVIEDPLVIADLTGHNPNVFYELAIRHAVRKPFIQLIEIGESIPFDVGNLRTVDVDHRDLDSVERCKAALIRNIRAIEAAPTDVESPISVSVDLLHLRRSDNPVEQGNAEILQSLAELRRLIIRTNRNLPNYENGDLAELRNVIAELAAEREISAPSLERLITHATSPTFDDWVRFILRQNYPATGPTYDDDEPF